MFYSSGIYMLVPLAINQVRTNYGHCMSMQFFYNDSSDEETGEINAEPQISHSAKKYF